jgi:hypothetical protein
MGRCGGWMKILALVLAAFTASCGDTGGKSSDSGNPFVFQTRGRLSLEAQPVPNTPTLKIRATLLDPQRNPLPNQVIAFSAEFQDVTIVPVLGNPTGSQGVAITDESGRAEVTLIAGLTRGRMRLIAEAPANLNIASAITVEIKEQGFIGGTALAILPTSATFINPFVNRDPDTMEGSVTFSAVGGTPPYRWENTNKDLGEIVPQGTFNERAEYRLIGPIPTDVGEALQDTVILIDSTGARITAPVTVIFADCTLQLSSTEVTLDSARPGDEVTVTILNGLPPFTTPPYTISQTRPDAGNVSLNADGTITYTVEDPAIAATDTVIVRDSRGCIGTFTVSVTPATVANLVLTANPTTISAETGGSVTITALAFDNNNQPFEGATIVFSADGGSFRPPLPPVRVTGADGRAEVTLDIPADTTATSITVTATSQGQTATITVTIEPPPEEE